MKMSKCNFFFTKTILLFWVIAPFMLVSCGSLDEQVRAEELLVHIAEELEQVESLSALHEKEMLLRNLWIELADVMILLHKEGRGKSPSLGKGALFLEKQMRRIYEMEGAREVVEASQREALIMLLLEEQKRQSG